MFTPQEIQEQTFSKAVFGGYDMQQVDDFLEPLTEDYITLYKENSVLKAKMKILVEKLEEYRAQETQQSSATAEAEAKSVGSRINLIDNVADARFISREEALQTFVKEYDAVMYDGVTAETMRDQYIVTLEDNSKLQETIDALKQVPGVATIYSDPTVANAMSTIRNVLSIVSACIAAVLLIVSLIIISNTIKLAMFDRREEIAIMRMVGATNGFIRLPFVVEGFILGLLGAVCSFFLEWGLYEAIRGAIASSGQLSFLHVVSFSTVALPVALVCVVTGLLIGVVGSLMSIRKFLKV